MTWCRGGDFCLLRLRLYDRSLMSRPTVRSQTHFYEVSQSIIISSNNFLHAYVLYIYLYTIQNITYITIYIIWVHLGVVPSYIVKMMILSLLEIFVT